MLFAEQLTCLQTEQLALSAVSSTFSLFYPLPSRHSLSFLFLMPENCAGRNQQMCTELYIQNTVCDLKVIFGAIDHTPARSCRTIALHSKTTLPDSPLAQS